MSRRQAKIVGIHFFSGKVFGETSGFKLSAISWRNSLKCFCRPTVANFSKDNLQTILRCPRHLVWTSATCFGFFAIFRSPDLLEVWSITDSTLSVAAHFSANSLTHQSYLEESGSHQLHVWLNFSIFYKLFLDKLQGNRSFWSKDGLDTREVPSRAKESSACQGLARGPWISRNHFRYHWYHHWHI